MKKYTIKDEVTRVTQITDPQRRKIESDYVRRLKEVIKWSKHNNLTIGFSFNQTSHFQWENNVIVLNSRLSAQNKLFILLHEIGHFLVDKHPSNAGRFSYGYTAKTISNAHNRHKLDILDEEFEAWHKGWSIGLDHNFITLSHKKAWDKTKYSHINAYAKWTTDRSFKTINDFKTIP